MELNVFLDRISEPARCAIEQLRCTKLEDLLSYSDKELLALHGLGPKTIRILNDFLEENKLDRKPKEVLYWLLMSNKLYWMKILIIKKSSSKTSIR